MESLTKSQREVVRKFIDQARNLIENGYAYAFAHPETYNSLRCELSRIKEMENLFKVRPLKCHQKMIRDAYIRFFVMLTKLGFKYVQHHPEFYKEVVELQNVFDEIDRVNSKHNFVNKKELETADFDSTEEVFNETHQKLNSLVINFDNIKERLETLGRKCNIRKSCDGMEELNEELKKRLREIKREKETRMRAYDGKESDEISSEELLEFNDFNQTPMKQNPARVGPIQRNFVIPVKTEKTKITPKYYFKRDGNDKMTFDLKLDFENGVIYNDRVANGIYIESKLPLRNSQRHRRNLFQ